MLVFAVGSGAHAQNEPVPEPPPGDSQPLSDEELIRWAANEVRIHERRAPEPPRPPVPPASYLGSEEPLALPGEGERDALRVLGEFGGGVAGVVIGGALAALAVWCAIEAGAAPDVLLLTGAAATAIGAFAITGGVTLAGDALGGNGRFADAFIGQLIGSLAALPLVTVGLMNDAPGVAIASAALLPLAGALRAYEFSHANRSHSRAYAAPMPGGATVGLVGSVP